MKAIECDICDKVFPQGEGARISYKNYSPGGSWYWESIVDLCPECFRKFENKELPIKINIIEQIKKLIT